MRIGWIEYLGGLRDRVGGGRSIEYKALNLRIGLATHRRQMMCVWFRELGLESKDEAWRERKMLSFVSE